MAKKAVRPKKVAEKAKPIENKINEEVNSFIENLETEISNGVEIVEVKDNNLEVEVNDNLETANLGVTVSNYDEEDENVVDTLHEKDVRIADLSDLIKKTNKTINNLYDEINRLKSENEELKKGLSKVEENKKDVIKTSEKQNDETRKVRKTLEEVFGRSLAGPSI